MAEDGAVQRIGVSTSTDLYRWSRVTELLVQAHPSWYRRRPDAGPHEHWRDPWVVRDECGLWHMYITAQLPGDSGHGVVGHATSTDLRSWDVARPLSQHTGLFDQLEVISLTRVDGRWVLMFSCLSGEMPGAERGSGGVWTVPVDGPGAQVDVAAAVRLTTEDLYVGKLVPLRDGSVRFLAFENRDQDGRFVGGVIDPLEVMWNRDGTGLELVGGPARWRP